MAEFDPQRILGVLDDHRVRYVLVGGLAAALHGAEYVTTDVDITPDTSEENLERLAEALRELDARIRTADEPAGVPFEPEADLIARSQILNLTTDAGDLDLSVVPAGTEGYRDLRRNAVDIDIRGIRVPVAALADVVRSKEAAGRPKDEAVLPMLRRMLHEEKGLRSDS